MHYDYKTSAAEYSVDVSCVNNKKMVATCVPLEHCIFSGTKTARKSVPDRHVLEKQ
jgi:hypothetical protein